MHEKFEMVRPLVRGQNGLLPFGEKKRGAKAMRISIVEDDGLLLQNLRLLLNGEPGFEVVGAYATAEEALADLRHASPEVMLVDIGLPGMSGIELIKSAKEAMPELDIMAHTVFEDRDTIFSALKSGACGYVLKGCTPRELVEALIDLYEGGAPMSPKIARAVIREFQVGNHPEADLLTPREREILTGLEKGLTYKEVAQKCGISVHTVHTHIKNIYEKLQAKSRQDALLKARKKGIL